MESNESEQSGANESGEKPTRDTRSGDPDATVAIVLAAGKGTRMKSDLPKVLHRVAGLPMLDWVVRSLKAAGVDQQVIIVSPAMAKAIVASNAAGKSGDWQRFGSAVFCCQNTARGTGDAVASAWPAFEGVVKPPYVDADLIQGGADSRLSAQDLIICAGDTPALSGEALRGFIASCRDNGAAMGVLAMRVPDPAGYGRIVTDDGGNLVAIVEDRDATAEQKKINCCNSGVIFAKASVLFELLASLGADNSQGEYYLTDCLGMAVQQGLRVLVHEGMDHHDFAGVNDRSQLAEVEKTLVGRMIEGFLKSGVTFHNPMTCHVEADCRIGVDSEIGPGVTITGRTQIGRNCRIGPNVTLDDVEAGDGSVIGAGSVIRNYVVNPGEYVPPLSMIH